MYSASLSLFETSENKNHHVSSNEMCFFSFQFNNPRLYSSFSKINLQKAFFPIRQKKKSRFLKDNFLGSGVQKKKIF